MSEVKFECECGQAIEAPAEMAGDLLNCPGCDKVMMVPHTPKKIGVPDLIKPREGPPAPVFYRPPDRRPDHVRLEEIAQSLDSWGKRIAAGVGVLGFLGAIGIADNGPTSAVISFVFGCALSATLLWALFFGLGQLVHIRARLERNEHERRVEKREAKEAEAEEEAKPRIMAIPNEKR